MLVKYVLCLFPFLSHCRSSVSSISTKKAIALSLSAANRTTVRTRRWYFESWKSCWVQNFSHGVWKVAESRTFTRLTTYSTAVGRTTSTDRQLSYLYEWTSKLNTEVKFMLISNAATGVRNNDIIQLVFIVVHAQMWKLGMNEVYATLVLVKINDYSSRWKCCRNRRRRRSATKDRHTTM